MLLSLCSVILAAASALASPAEGVTPTEAAAQPKFTPNSQRLENGFYRSFRNDAGEILHEKLGEINTNLTEVESLFPPEGTPQLRRASSGSCYCGCGFELNHGNCDIAVSGLHKQVLDGQPIWINAPYSYHTIHNDVIAYACNLEPAGSGAQSDGFYANNVAESTTYITQDCGWYIAGTHIWGYGKPLAVGYMRYTPNMDHCGNSITSNAKEC